MKTRNYIIITNPLRCVEFIPVVNNIECKPTPKWKRLWWKIENIIIYKIGLLLAFIILIILFSISLEFILHPESLDLFIELIKN